MPIDPFGPVLRKVAEGAASAQHLQSASHQVVDSLRFVGSAQPLRLIRFEKHFASALPAARAFACNLLGKLVN
jgi:hypothetical protein